MKTTLKHLKTSIIALAALTTSAGAVTYSYNNSEQPYYSSDRAGLITNVATSYDDSTQRLSWEHTIADADSSPSNGFWLVVSPGDNPKSNYEELVIFYGDGDNGILSAFEYNGQDNSNSYDNTDMEYFGSFDLAYADNGTSGTFSFSIDASDINAANLSPHWTGAAFGPRLGIWLHPYLNGSSTYDSEGQLVSLSHRNAAWYDVANVATSVPDSGSTLALFALALGGFLATRRRIVRK